MFSILSFLFRAHLHTTENKAKLYSYHITNNFGILYLINLISCKCIQHTVILQSKSAASASENTLFTKLIKNTHSCSSHLKVGSQQVVGTLDNKALMGYVLQRIGWGVVLDKGCLSRQSWVCSLRALFFCCLFPFFIPQP